MPKNDYFSELAGKHIVFTGANGFMGNNAAEQVLTNSDAKITAIVRPHSKNYKIKALRDRYPDRVSLIPCDTVNFQLNDEKKLTRIQEAIHGADALLHYAGAPKLENSKIIADLVRKTNIDGTVNIIKILQTLKTPPFFVGIGSVFETGIVKGTIYESMRYGRSFRNPYEKSKWKAANFVRDLFDKNQLEGYWFRPAIITGESSTGKGAEHGNLNGPAVFCALAAMRKKNTVRYAFNPLICLPFSHVDHTNTAILNAVAEKNAPNGTCFNLSSDRNVPLKEIANSIVKIINEKRITAPLLWGGAHKFRINYHKGGIVKPKELMIYAGPNAPVSTYEVDNTNMIQYLPRELSNPPLDISICLHHILSQLENKRKHTLKSENRFEAVIG